MVVLKANKIYCCPLAERTWVTYQAIGKFAVPCPVEPFVMRT